MTKINGHQKVNLTMFDIGQAECFLLEKGENNILIDCGNTKGSAKIIQALKEKGITKIDYIFTTHPHEDHMGGMYDIITKFQIGKIILPCINYKKTKPKWFQKLINEINNGNYQFETAKLEATYRLGGLEIKVISDGQYKGSNINNYSTVLKITYGQNVIIMTGDAETAVEKSILESGEEIKAQILKVAHHGSKSSTSKEFLDYIKPTYALISCGNGNKYNHPDKETIDKLNNDNIKVFRTDQMGTVEVVITPENICFLQSVEN